MTGRGHALPPVRWLFDLYCARVLGERSPGNQPNPGFPRTPSLASLPLSSTVCSILFFPPTATAHRGRTLPPVRWLFDLYCARVLRERGPGNQPVIFFFLKSERHFEFPHDSDCTTTKQKVCLGPGTAIQVSGALFCHKIGVPICSADLLGFPCRFGGGGGGGGVAYV